MELKVLKVRENAILPRYAHGNEDTGAKKVYWFTCGAEIVTDLQFLNLKWEHLGIDQPVKIFR